MERYNIKNVEKKWQKIWSTQKKDAAILDKKKKKFYWNLQVFQLTKNFQNGGNVLN